MKFRLRPSLPAVIVSVLLATATLVAQTNPQTLNTLDRRLVRYASTVITNAQVLTLHNTAITVIPAQGAGTFIEVMGGYITVKYTTTYSSGSNLKLWYTNRTSGPAASPAITVAGLLTGISANKIQYFGGIPDGEVLGVTGNEPITIEGTSSTAFTGGAAANVVTVRVAYRVHNTGF